MKEFTDIINEVCRDCKTKEEAIKRLHDFRLIDVRGVKYLLIHKFFQEKMFNGMGIMDAMYETAFEYNISIAQVQIIRNHWKKKQTREEVGE